jgi:serine/threonine protein kinase
VVSGHRPLEGRKWSPFSPLGAILYFVLTGQPPFRGANLVETLLEVLKRNPRPPRRIDPSVPAELEAICLKCLRKRPAQRYTTAAELAEDLGRWLRDERQKCRGRASCFAPHGWWDTSLSATSG